MELFYVLPSGKYLGAVVGDTVDSEDNVYKNLGYVQVPYPPESSDWYWDFDGNNYYLPPLAGDALLAFNSAKLQGLMATCIAQKNALTNRVATIQDAIDVDMVTPEEAAEKAIRVEQLIAWKRHGVLLGRVTAQTGWYVNVDWPIAPVEGMDLSVSAPLA